MVKDFVHYICDTEITFRGEFYNIYSFSIKTRDFQMSFWQKIKLLFGGPLHYQVGMADWSMYALAHLMNDYCEQHKVEAAALVDGKPTQIDEEDWKCDLSSPS